MLYDFVYTNSKNEKIDAVYLELTKSEWLKKKKTLFSKYF